MAFIKEYRGFSIEANRYSVFAYGATDDFSCETLADAEAKIDRIRDDEAADAEWERGQAEASLARLDATLSAVSADTEIKVEPDMRDLCREWSANAAARAKEYRQWAEHYRERLAYCEEQAERHERIAKADLEAANG